MLKGNTAICSLALALVCATGVCAQTPEEFYRGKTISLIVSSAPGGGYDATARITARTLPRHIPGNPNVVVRNMPGAGGIIAPNFVYARSERDGTVIALMQNTIPFEPLFGNKAATFDPLKLLWLGSPNVETGIFMIWHEAGIRDYEDLRKKEITVGVPAIASQPAYLSRLLIKTMDFKLRIVPGYPSANASLLAMEKGEVESFPNFYNSLMASRPNWLKEKKTVLVVQWGGIREKALADVPYIPEILKDPDKLALLNAASASFDLGRPFMMPPDVPRDRYEAMHAAMMATFNDPAFADDAKKIGFADLMPQTGAQIEKIVRDVYAASPEVVKQLRMIATGEGM